MVKAIVLQFIVGSTLLVGAARGFAHLNYGRRVVGNLPSNNDQLKIDGPAEETWKRNIGEPIMFRCVTGQASYPVFVWSKDGRDPPRNAIKYQLISNGNSFLEIPRTTLKSEGNYTCTVSNEFGVARKVYRLCIIAPGVKEDCPGWWYNWLNQ